MKKFIILKPILVGGAFLILSRAFGQQLSRTIAPQENKQKEKAIAGEKTVKQVQPTENRIRGTTGSLMKQQKVSEISDFPTHMQYVKEFYETTFSKQLSTDEFKKNLKLCEQNLAVWKKAQLHYKENKGR